MDWSKIERLVHQQHENSFARSTGTVFSTQPTCTGTAGRSYLFSSNTRSPEHELHANQRTNDLAFLRPPPSSDYQQVLADEVTSLRKGLFDAIARINELQNGVIRQDNALRQSLELENRVEEMERKLAVTSQHLNSSFQTNEQLQVQSRRLQSQVEDLHQLTATLQEVSVSKEAFAKLLDSQRLENKQLHGEMKENGSLSRGANMQLQQLLRTICTFGDIEPEKLELFTSFSIAGGGNELFMHQLGDIILQSLQHGVDLSVAKHVIMLKSTLNTAIANLLNEFKTRQLAAMQPHFDRVQTLQSEVAVTQNKVFELQSDIKTVHFEVKAIEKQAEKEAILTLPPSPPPTVTIQAHTTQEDFELLKQELQVIATQQTTQKTQLTQLFSELQALSHLIADSQKTTLQTQNLRFTALETQILENQETAELAKRLRIVDNRLAEVISGVSEKNREFVDRLVNFKLELAQFTELQQMQKVELVSQLENRVLLLQEEQRVSLGKLQLELHDSIRDKFRVFQAEMQANNISNCSNNQEKNEGTIIATNNITEDASQLLHDQIKHLHLEIDTLQSRLLSSHDEFRVLMTTRDADLVSRVNDRIAHLEILKNDYFHAQKAALTQLEEKVEKVEIKVGDLVVSQHTASSTTNNNHILEEKIEYLVYEQDSLKTRISAQQTQLETAKTDLLLDIEKTERTFQRQLQIHENRLVTSQQTIENRCENLENSLQKVQEKLVLEVEKNLENLGSMQLKVRNCEFEEVKLSENVARFESRLQFNETEMTQNVDSKTQILEQKLTASLQQQKLEFSSQHTETVSRVENVAQKVDFLSTHCENKFSQLEGKIEENYATHSRLFVEGERSHQAQQIRVLSQMDELKHEISTNFSSIALQQEQLSAYIEKLDFTTSQKTLLLETEGIATRNIAKAEISKIAKSLNEVSEELKFDVSHVNNRLMILEQQVNFADNAVASSSPVPSAPTAVFVQPHEIVQLQKSLASQQEQLQVLQEELVTLDSNHGSFTRKLETMHQQLVQVQQAQQQQQQLLRANSNSGISYAAESKQPPPRNVQQPQLQSPTSPKPGAVSGPPISAISAFMSSQQQFQQQQPVKALNPAVARAMAGDPRVMPQQQSATIAAADAKDAKDTAMLTPAKPSAPSSSRQQQSQSHHHHGAVLLSPMASAPNSASSSAPVVSGGSSSSLHPSPPSAVKNAANVSPRPRLSPPAVEAAVAAPALAVNSTAVAVPVAIRLHPNQEEEDEQRVEDSQAKLHQQQQLQQAIDEQSFESDDDDPPLHLLDEVMKRKDDKHDDDSGPETSSSPPSDALSSTSAAVATGTLHLTKGAPPSVDPSSMVMASAASYPKTPPKHPQPQQHKPPAEEKLSIETVPASAALIPVLAPFSPARQQPSPAAPLQRTLSAGSNSSTTSSASKFSRRFNEASMTPPPTNSSRRSDSFDEDEAAHMLSGSFEGIALHLGGGTEDEFVSDSENENERSSGGILSSLPGSAVKSTVLTGGATSAAGPSLMETASESKKSTTDTVVVAAPAAEVKEAKPAEAKTQQSPVSSATEVIPSTIADVAPLATVSAPAPAVIVSGSLLGRSAGGTQQRK